ncbi:MAG: Polypeptide-transport-associated domain protein FtsQ-type [Candidatus Collierbacteria bacterium GW2011_GWB1_45_35]|uniref:Polypeptide-transport-associated domain protein FtsQ-type n=1 Tax=Candidatus Collierbacteria bacterium GW2011_GWB2_45_17 TaxID=1618388 RepID=A0A837IJD8_9BACT|nr:MAG: Polypeptide-transport-associated domain protein FtsQ-type [Microgenomates group bacterium GW2011_GWC1_44_23]KKT95896.1 MAG: Polypeptide-transport-associated domain protein FtsQ-type [Candidatus Collierbacteria bacterium GW2011_GWA1_45_15]KKU01000.1 MAG: Polypeptide-transport-associated domain protein FtsQ-type [Candidatus Collierbacteria bacterium GW2011_GWB2_45_17]KKU05907.1 MAG: Polypeptide-transport-associated domain protein FtsQ-type [Candidatus Collierbacteria bacterium GW2011_GWB1_
MLQKRLRTPFDSPFNRLGRLLRRLLPLFILFLFIFLANNLFTVRKIECVFNNDACSSAVFEKLNKYLGSNVLLINQKDISSSINSLLSVENIKIGFKVFNTLSLRLNGRLVSLNAQVSLTQELPRLSLDDVSLSSDSAEFIKPTEEINQFNKTVNFSNFEIWDNGLMSPVASAESKIKYLFTEKPTVQTVKSVYALVKLVEKYLNADQIMILNQKIFLRQANQPDIIVNIPFDEDNLVQALQSYEYLTTIKKDTKVIDLRFKNPILR